VRRRRRKKIPPAERQPLIRPGTANEVWSMDFVFDRIASGRVLKCLTIVDDATHEAVAVIPEHSISGDHLVRLLDEVCAVRGKPAVIRTDYGPEYLSTTLAAWAAKHGIALNFIQPSKPQQNAHIERYNRTVRYDWLGQYLFASIHEVQNFATCWLWTYNHERPNMALGGITPKQKLALVA
jgi:putative transposase